MLGDGSLTFREFAMGEPLPLARIQDALLEFLRGRDDAVLYGAQAVNAYVPEPRLSQDVDLLSARAEALAEEIRAQLGKAFGIAVRVREIGAGRGYRVYQVRKEGSRHLVDVRAVATLPPAQRIGGVLVLLPAELVASKVLAWHTRRGRPKSWTDRRDIAALLLVFPELGASKGPVRQALVAAGASSAVLGTWEEIARQPVLPEDEDGEFA